jgi:hypothetical protein
VTECQNLEDVSTVLIEGGKLSVICRSKFPCNVGDGPSDKVGIVQISPHFEIIGNGIQRASAVVRIEYGLRAV